MLSDRFYLFNITLSLIFIQASFWLVFLNRNNVPPVVPLYYFEPWGEKQLVPSQNLWILVILPLGICLFNFLLANYLYRKEKIFSQGLALVSSVVSFLSFFALWIILTRIGIL